MMKILSRPLRHFLSLIILSIQLNGALADKIKSSLQDVEAELLDKEYGVRYASACEGE